MKRGHLLGIASLSVALASACGNGINTAGDDAGIDVTSGSGSGAGGPFGSSGTASSGGSSGTSSGTASSGGTSSSSGGRSASSSGSGSGGVGSSSSGGRRDAGGSSSSGSPTRTNDCPNCPGSQLCCLTPMGGNLQGTCAATASACPTGGASVACGTSGDCNGTDVCCITIASSSGPSSTSCQASCPSNSPPSCSGMPGDNVDCPGGPGGWACQPVPGTPTRVLGECVPTEGGAPPADGGDASATDAESGAPPQDAAGDGG
jgi:hypothetical protein